jgi:hypothetical protein
MLGRVEHVETGQRSRRRAWDGDERVDIIIDFFSSKNDAADDVLVVPCMNSLRFSKVIACSISVMMLLSSKKHNDRLQGVRTVSFGSRYK